MEMEPALSDAVAGGIYLPAERHVRPESLTKALKKWLISNGAEVLSHTEATGFIQEGDKISGVKTRKKPLKGITFLSLREHGRDWF